MTQWLNKCCIHVINSLDENLDFVHACMHAGNLIFGVVIHAAGVINTHVTTCGLGLKIIIIIPGIKIMSISALLVNPSLHITIAPSRSVDVLVVIMEVRGDVDVRLKEYIVSLIVMMSLLLPMIISLEKYRSIMLLVSGPLDEKSNSHCSSV